MKKSITYHFLILFIFLSVSLTAQNRRTNNWPKVIPLENISITIYQPDVESIDGNYLEARAAFNIYDGTRLPVFGALWLTARMAIDHATETVTYSNITITDVSFPDATEAKKKEFKELLLAVAPTWHIKSTLDDLRHATSIINLDDKSSHALNNDPPNVFYEQTPTELIFIDGEPILENIDGSVLYKYVVNTPHFIVYSSSDKFFYLKSGIWWFRAPDIYAEWKNIGAPPQSIMDLDERFNDYTPEKTGQTITNSTQKPQLFVVTFPSALIETRGAPELIPLPGTGLSYVDNTDNDLLKDEKSKEYYVRFSGRWYKSKTLFRGDWKFVPPKKIPTHFLKIPPESKVGHVRISIPGTPEAMQAALNNFIPQTAIIDRKIAEMQVEYDGDPIFEPIEDTKLHFAINTKSSVLKIAENSYYAVDEAVWFTANSPEGPWQVATEVPVGVADIPPSSPVYNIKYVYIYEASPEYAYVGYTAGYLGNFLYQGCVFYGTGYQYKPWYKSKYIPRPVTYAFGINRTDNGKGGNIHVSVGVGYGFGGYGYGYPGFYNPYGYYGGVGITHYSSVSGNYELKKGYEAKPLDQVNIYNNRVKGVVATEYAQRSNPYIIPKENQQAIDGSFVPPTNLYTDKKGNIYREETDGTWSQRVDGVWVKTKRDPRTR